MSSSESDLPEVGERPMSPQQKWQIALSDENMAKAREKQKKADYKNALESYIRARNELYDATKRRAKLETRVKFANKEDAYLQAAYAKAEAQRAAEDSDEWATPHAEATAARQLQNIKGKGRAAAAGSKRQRHV